MRQRKSESEESQQPRAPEIDSDFEELLDYLKRVRGFDFTGYKRASLKRRVQKRMQIIAVADFISYKDYLEVHPDEFGHLFNMILINVTAFFRDPSVWDYLQESVVPLLLADLPEDAPIRLWSACCASGEEAYSLAMLLAEVLGIERFRERVKIYATDIDEEALNHGRRASYSQREVGGVPTELLEKYFEISKGHYVLHKDLRRAVIFGRHDLIRDAPISRVRLLTCRNALMYLNAEVQAKVLSRLHFALDDRGILVLGKAEMLFAHATLFTPLDLQYRIFTKISKPSLRGRLMLISAETNHEVTQTDAHGQIRDMAFKAGPVAQIVVDITGQIVLINDRARTLFRLGDSDINRPLHDLELSYRPADLRSMIDQAYADRRPAVQREVAWTGLPGETRFFDVQAVAVLENEGLMGAAITFTEVTSLKRLRDDLNEAHHELETAYEELQSTVEELETTNEELQSTVEELETTNEELQSINEELETMNEELQSTNEELQATNDEARRHAGESDQANAYLGAILTSLRAGVVVLDRNLLIQIWNKKSEDLWGLRAEEVQGKQFLLLDIGLPVEQLNQPIRNCLRGEKGTTEITRTARNRRGKDFVCEVSFTPLVGLDDKIQGVILFMDEANAPSEPTAS